MSGTMPAAPEHGALMDAVYRRQRHIYDVTRKYYLFGRDRMIDALAPGEGARILEIGCGTGRNLALIDRRWSGMRLHGLDVSSEMLKSAAARLGDDVRLARGDARSFDPEALFGTAEFDRIVLPYCLSMIPQWQRALDHAAGMLAPGGELHVVDFGAMRGLPRPARLLLRTWLARFHVTPRDDLPEQATSIAHRRGLVPRGRQRLGGYYVSVVLKRR